MRVGLSSFLCNCDPMFTLLALDLPIIQQTASRHAFPPESALPPFSRLRLKGSLSFLGNFQRQGLSDRSCTVSRSSHCANRRNHRSREHEAHSPNDSLTRPDGRALPFVWWRLSKIHTPSKYPCENHPPFGVHTTSSRFAMRLLSYWSPLKRRSLPISKRMASMLNPGSEREGSPLNHHRRHARWE